MNVVSFVLLLFNAYLGVECATFENVFLLLSSESRKLYVNGKPATKTVFVGNSDALGAYVNLQPLEIVKIEKQRVPVLNENSVSNLPNAVAVAITSSGVEEIRPGAFRNLPKVDHLNLSHNALEEIRNGVFNDLNLISLSLENNRIFVLGDKAFNNMILTNLILDNNRISTWSSDWFRGTALGSIRLSGNLLEELPANSFEYYVKLSEEKFHVTVQNLDLAHNRLKKIDPNAFNGVAEFGYLGLQNNELEYLPSNMFHTVRHIEVLELSNNKIKDVGELFHNTVIGYLRLHNNSLSCFPLEVFNVTKIHHMSMDGNPVTCNCVKIFEKWHQESTEKLVYLEKARRTCINA